MAAASVRSASCSLNAFSWVGCASASSRAVTAFAPCGMADSAAGKSMKVKPVTDADVKKMNEAQMIEAVKNGMGKMQPYNGKLTDAQIKDVVGYFRTFLK